jgi:Uma2 family endonuclease
VVLPARTDATAPLTAEGRYDPPSSELRYELVSGQLRVSEPAGFGHTTLTMRLERRMLAFVEQHGLGDIAGADGAFVLSRDPDTARAPDVGFVRAERRPPRDVVHEFFEGAPDLAVEVISPTDRATELMEKVDDYLAAGTRLVWVVDPQNGRVATYLSGGVGRVLRGGDTPDGGDGIPGFTCPVTELSPKRRSIH